MIFLKIAKETEKLIVKRLFLLGYLPNQLLVSDEDCAKVYDKFASLKLVPQVLPEFAELLEQYQGERREIMDGIPVVITAEVVSIEQYCLRTTHSGVSLYVTVHGGKPTTVEILNERKEVKDFEEMLAKLPIEMVALMGKEFPNGKKVDLKTFIARLANLRHAQTELEALYS